MASSCSAIVIITSTICLTLLVGCFYFYLPQQVNHNAASTSDDGVVKQVINGKSSSSSGGVGLKDQEVFDYFMLALQWPSTYCRSTKTCCDQNGCCRGENALAEFTIHGLWTNYDDGSYPSCCDGPAFDYSEISILIDELNKFWPTLSCSNSSTCHGGKDLFWAHEWEKHGTCSYPVFQDEYVYFVATLNLYFKYNVTEALIEAGYVPSDSEQYPLQGISSAIKSAFNITPEITCSSGAVVEVRLCFYKDFQPRDCDATCSIDNSCPENVSLPAFASYGLKDYKTKMQLGTGKSSV